MSIDATVEDRMTFDAAKAITAAIAADPQHAGRLLRDALEGKAHLSLGFASWGDFLRSKLSISEAHAAQLMADAATLREGEQLTIEQEIALDADMQIEAELDALSEPELARLTECEAMIAAGLHTFVQVGNALLEIRDSRLYRRHSTFEEYCRHRWNVSRAQAHRLMGAANVIRQMSPIGDKPATESQTRPLTKLDSAEEQGVAWREAQRVSGEVQPTARVVEAVVEVMKRRTKQADALAVRETWDEETPARGMQLVGWGLAHIRKIDRNDAQREEALTLAFNQLDGMAPDIATKWIAGRA